MRSNQNDKDILKVLKMNQDLSSNAIEESHRLNTEADMSIMRPEEL